MFCRLPHRVVVCALVLAVVAAVPAAAQQPAHIVSAGR